METEININKLSANNTMYQNQLSKAVAMREVAIDNNNKLIAKLKIQCEEIFDHLDESPLALAKFEHLRSLLDFDFDLLSSSEEYNRTKLSELGETLIKIDNELSEILSQM